MFSFDGVVLLFFVCSLGWLALQGWD